MDVGFIGLGLMGRAMAANLIKAGHRLRVWNRSTEAAKALVDAGATLVDSPAGAFAGDAVITMLADDAAVRAVLLETGILDRARPGTLHIGMSTLSIALTRELTALHDAKGLRYVAAPVFGRPEAAQGAMLNILVAGDPASVAEAQPLFDAMGQKTWPLGDDPAKTGAVKLAGNLMIAAAIEAMAEATALGMAHGVSSADLLDVLTNTLFACPAYKSYGASIAAERYEPAAFKLRLGLKDVRLALQAGDNANVPLPFGSVLRDTFLSAVAQGDGEKDWSALAAVIHARAGQKPSRQA